MTSEAKHELFKFLDKIGSKLDISKTQYEMAKSRYKAVGNWLAKGEYCLTNVCLKDGEIYPQGSIRLGTTVKPIGQEEFDVDLVFFTPNVSRSDIKPTELNRLIGNRLREHEKYRNMIEPLKRGWRITYADEFHLDITPSINNHTEDNNSEFVPDRKLQDWKPSNPKDYAEWLDSSALKLPEFSYIFKDSVIVALEEHRVSDFPENNEIKSLLKRYIQILKRHRDIMFQGKEHRPISIIISTLATYAYNDCISKKVYDNEFDLLVDVIKEMSNFIQYYGGKYFILNPTTDYENFAERWNEVPAKKKAFDLWHKDAFEFFTKLSTLTGHHKIFKSLEEKFGEKPVSMLLDDINRQVKSSRGKGLLN